MDRSVLALCVAVVFRALADGQAPPEARHGAARHGAASPGAIDAATSSAVSGFIENAGQWPPEVRFIARGGDTPVLVEREGFRLGAAVRLVFEGACEASEVSGEGQLPGVYRFLQGRGVPGTRGSRGVARAYSRVLWRHVQDGVDIVLRKEAGDLEYDLIVDPGSDLSRVIFRCEGAEEVFTEDDGSLMVLGPHGALRQRPPRTWEVLPGSDVRPLPCRYRDLGFGRFGFEADRRDLSLPLVVDPLLEWSVLLGGYGEEHLTDIGLSATGEVTVCGFTSSFEWWPPEAGGSQVQSAGGFDAFVARLDRDGNLVWWTFLGGSDEDMALALAVEPGGSTLLAGRTRSVDFPIEDLDPDALQPVSAGGIESFVVRLDGDGEPVGATFLGGPSDDWATDIAIDQSGRAVLAGNTYSPSFPTTPGAFQARHGGVLDNFVTILDVSSTGPWAVVYSTFVGGSAMDNQSTPWPDDVGQLLVPNIIAGPGSDLILAGGTFSHDFPTTPGAVDTRYETGRPAFILRLRPDATLPPAAQLVYGTYLASDNTSSVADAILDTDGTVIATGWTYSPSFPVTAAAYDTTFGGGNDGFVTRVRPDPALPIGEQLPYSTFFGGGAYDPGRYVALDASGAVTLAGYTTSGDLPTTPGALDRAHSGGWWDLYLARMVLDRTLPPSEQLAFSTYLGGTGDEDARPVVAVEPSGRLFLAGDGGADFPNTAATPSLDGSNAFVARIDLVLPVAAFTVGGTGEGTLVVDASSSSTPEGTIESYLWDFGEPGGETRLDGATATHDYSAPGRYEITLTVVNSLGASRTVSHAATVSCPARDVLPWTAVDVGQPVFPGSSRREGETMALCAGGRGTSSAGDELHMAYQERDGDFVLTARLADLSGGNLLAWAGAGLMVRESLEAKAAFVALLAEKRFVDDRPTELYLRVRYRVATDVSPSLKDLGTIKNYGTEPLWLRLRRTGGTVSAFISRSPEGTFAETPDHEMDISSDPMLAALAAFGRDGTDAARPLRALEATFEEVDLGDPTLPGPEFIRGDANSDGSVDISDGISILGYLFLGGPAPTCLDAADANDSAGAPASDGVDIADAVYVLNHLFQGGPAPPAPFGACGPDETEDGLGCESFVGCP